MCPCCLWLLLCGISASYEKHTKRAEHHREQLAGGYPVCPTHCAQKQREEATGATQGGPACNAGEAHGGNERPVGSEPHGGKWDSKPGCLSHTEWWEPCRVRYNGVRLTLDEAAIFVGFVARMVVSMECRLVICLRTSVGSG